MKKAFFSFLKKKSVERERHVSHARHLPDFWFVFFVFVIALFGILMVYNSSVAIAMRDFSDPYHFVRDQIRWIGIGTILFIFFSFIDYRVWFRFSLPLLLIVLLLLLAVFIPGIGIRALGAHRWINFGFFVLQPAELSKLAIVIYLAAWFSYKEKRRTIAFLLLLSMVVGLIMLEPDMGTAMILLTIALILYFFSGAPLSHFFIIIPIVIIGVGVLAIIAPYRIARLTTFVNPQSDPLGASYHIRQVLLSLGSGGWFGVGLGKSRQKYAYLPEANTDSIFAIIGEEVGFIGAVGLIILFCLLVWRGIRIAKYIPDPFGKLIALGVSFWIGIQAMVNIGSMVALVPLTGVPLPLISYGGSSLIVLFSALGIVTNISRHSHVE